jgi:hypothetical protein
LADDDRAESRICETVIAFEFTSARAYRPRVRWSSLTFLFLALAIAANAQTVKVLKVLPQYLDKKGHASLSPSLFERDAYQAQIRTSETNRSALQFKVNWVGRGFDELNLRVEAKGGTPRKPKTIVLEEKVHPGFFSKWSSFKVADENYKELGELIAWRTTLWFGTNQLAEQKSFLW